MPNLQFCGTDTSVTMERWLNVIGPAADLAICGGLQLGTAAIFGGMAVSRLAKRRFALA